MILDHHWNQVIFLDATWMKHWKACGGRPGSDRTPFAFIRDLAWLLGYSGPRDPFPVHLGKVLFHLILLHGCKRLQYIKPCMACDMFQSGENHEKVTCIPKNGRNFKQRTCIGHCRKGASFHIWKNWGTNENPACQAKFWLSNANLIRSDPICQRASTGEKQRRRYMRNELPAPLCLGSRWEGFPPYQNDIDFVSQTSKQCV